LPVDWQAVGLSLCFVTGAPVAGMGSKLCLAAHDVTAHVKCMLVNVKHSFDKYAAYNKVAESSVKNTATVPCTNSIQNGGIISSYTKIPKLVFYGHEA
jgi:hypothetical protein